jgi:hypothetical protein
MFIAISGPKKSKNRVKYVSFNLDRLEASHQIIFSVAAFESI